MNSMVRVLAALLLPGLAGCVIFLNDGPDTPDPGATRTDPQIQICNQLDNFENIIEVYTTGPSDMEPQMEFAGTLMYGECVTTGNLYPGTWGLRAYDAGDYCYMHSVQLDYGDFVGWDVTYDYECD